MAITLPKIEIKFKQLAGSAIERSKRGIAVLIVKDNTDTSIRDIAFKDMTEIDKVKDKFTVENITFMKDVMEFGAYKLIVVRMDAPTVDTPVVDTPNADTVTKTKKQAKIGVDLNKALSIVTRITKTGWITIAKGTKDEYKSLASFITAREREGKTYKAIVYKVDTLDSMHVVNFFNDNITFKDERGEKSGEYYLPSILGVLASCNINRSATYYKCSNLKGCSEIGNKDTVVQDGKFFLIEDEGIIKIASGINSLTTTNGLTLTEDMKYIDVVEAMDLIADDISDVFKNEYVGKYKNNYNNQLLFISAINGYLKNLANDYILDNNYNNHTDVDIQAQKDAFNEIGKDTSDWDNITTKNNTFKRTVFLLGDIKILSAMENLNFTVYLF